MCNISYRLKGGKSITPILHYAINVVVLPIYLFFTRVTYMLYPGFFSPMQYLKLKSSRVKKFELLPITPVFAHPKNSEGRPGYYSDIIMHTDVEWEIGLLLLLLLTFFIIDLSILLVMLFMYYFHLFILRNKELI